jgi:quinol monooxygenase YgiN
MYGTVAYVKVQPGKEEEFVATGTAWSRERGEQTGQVAEYLFKLDEGSGAYCLVGIFRDRETYRANAADPDTDRWYQKLRATLAADPEWHDGEVVQSAMLSGI